MGKDTNIVRDNFFVKKFIFHHHFLITPPLVVASKLPPKKARSLRGRSRKARELRMDAALRKFKFLKILEDEVQKRKFSAVRATAKNTRVAQGCVPRLKNFVKG